MEVFFLSTLEISQMIDLMEDHFAPLWNRNHVLTVGGVIGTSIFKYAMDACMKYYELNQILVIDGCQDYIGLLKKPMHNYMYYMDLFVSIRIPSIEEQMNPYHKFPMELKSGYRMALVNQKLTMYEAIIIQNAHLIPENCLKSIHENFNGQILQIVDPLDFNGIDFHTIPTLYDSLSKQSPMTALARSMFGIDSRCIDRKIHTEFKKMKMSKRSIGKIDTNQYVTNSQEVLNIIQRKQIQSQFRKNQKFIVGSEEIRLYNDQNGEPVTVGPGTMLTLSSVTKPLIQLRVHSSLKHIYSTLSYKYTEKSLYVKPANIITIDDAVYHRFNSLVVVLSDEPMTNRLWYSLMKIANTITVVDF